MKINEKNLGPKHEFGRRLLDAFTYIGLGGGSLRDNGEKIGITASALGRALHGKQAISNQTGMAVSSLTKVDHNWLMTGQGTMRRKIDHDFFTEDDKTLIQKIKDHFGECNCFEGLDEDQAKVIKTAIRGMRNLNSI